ncbi:hypothetical protein M8J77_019717 [Diaphorina citri]|nr:hypothetical protein M8J77_019717 [Diaphorina citri]
MEGEGSPESKEKTKMDALSKEDLVQKCTKLLHISRQAQLAKQESTIQLKQIQEKFIAAEKIIEELKTSNESLVKDLKECNHIRDSVVNKLGQVNVETKQLIEQGEKLTNDIEFLKQEKLKLYEELSSSQKENEILRQTTGDLEVRLMQMNEVKGEMEFKIKELNKKNQSESKLSDTIRELNEENIGLKQKVELQEAENQLIQTTVNTLEKTLDKKETLIAEYAEDIRKLQQEEKKMKETLSEVTNRFEDEVKRLQGACDEKDNVKNKLEDKVKELNVICDENNNVIKNFQAELKKLQDTLSEKEQIIDSHVETIGQLKQTVRDAEERVKMIQKGDEEKTKALESVQSALSEKDRVIEALNEAIRKESSAGLEGNDKLKQMTLDISEKQQKLNTCEADLKEAHRKLVSLEKTNDTNVEKLDRLSAELSDKNEAIEKLENDLIEKDKMFKSTLQNKEVECSELMNSVQREMEHKTIALQEMETVQTVLKQNLEVITGLENDLKGRDAELDQATNRIELLVFELDEKSILLKQLEGDVLQRDEQVVALRTALKEKEERLEQVVALQTALKETEERLEVKEERLKDLENETKTAAEQLKRAEKEFEESRAKVADLEHELGEKKAALENEKKTKEELLKNKEANRTLIDTELEQLKKDLEDTQAKLVETNQQIVSKCELIETQSHQLEAARVLIESLERAIQNSEDSQREKSNYELEKQENFKLSLENLENDNIRCKREIEHLTEELERASERYRSKCSENEELKRMYDAMNGNYAKLNTDHQQQLVRIQTTARLLAALKQEKSQLLTYVRETQHAVHADIACAVRYADKMKTIRTEQDQLLREMSEMNESLKGRGEKIYSLNEEIGRLESEKQEAQQSLATMENEMKQLRAQLDGKQQNLATLENEMKDLRAQLNGKEHSLATVEEEMKDLRSELSEEKDVKKRMNEEITKLKGELKKKEELGVTMATQSASLDKMETLSTSTISKADETNRMKDIEDTYEDRYMKLKLLTIKYKKSYVETNEKLTTLTNENAALMSKLQALTNQIKTTQILQSEYDSLCEKQDADARTLKSNAKFIAQLTHDKETLENSLRSLRTQLNDASTQKSDALAKYASLKEKFDEKQVRF